MIKIDLFSCFFKQKYANANYFKRFLLFSAVAGLCTFRLAGLSTWKVIFLINASILSINRKKMMILLFIRNIAPHKETENLTQRYGEERER